MGIKPKPPLGEITETDAFHSKRTNKYGKVYHHAGQDLRAKLRTPVKAILDGVVVRSFHRKPKTEGAISYGNVIVLYHGENAKTGKHTYSLYAHLSKRDAKAREKVNRGAIIGFSGDTENVPPHLHIEVKESPKKITWYTSGNKLGDYIYGEYSISPKIFLQKDFIKIIEPLTDAESATLHSMVTWKFERGPRPTLFVEAPPFKEVMRKIRPGTDITDIEPPIFSLKFENAFSREFNDQYPSVTLNVNGRTVDKVRTGTTSYDLSIWN